jgi:hypothetical protein
MAAQADERVTISERIAPGVLPRVLCGVAVLAAVLIYAISDHVHRREAPTPTMTPAG